jgi:hypothetical protein
MEQSPVLDETKESPGKIFYIILVTCVIVVSLLIVGGLVWYFVYGRKDEGLCIPECLDAKEYCDAQTHQCKNCGCFTTTSNRCDTSGLCFCGNNPPCIIPTPVCNYDTGVCAECVTDADCVFDTQNCDITTGTCVAD